MEQVLSDSAHLLHLRPQARRGVGVQVGLLPLRAALTRSAAAQWQVPFDRAHQERCCSKAVQKSQLGPRLWWLSCEGAARIPWHTFGYQQSFFGLCRNSTS